MGAAFNLLVTLCAFAITVWVMVSWLRRSDDPMGIVYKWILTALLFAALLGLGAFAGGGGVGGAFMVPLLTAAVGIILGILWAPNLGGLLASPITSAFEGDSEAVRRPLYSRAVAQRKRGHGDQAIREVQEQLAEFPADYEGWMLLAEIYAADFKHNQHAQECVERILGIEGLHPKNIAFALGRSADWHLALDKNRDAAAGALERVVALLPETEHAQLARQRLARLSPDGILSGEDRHRNLRVGIYAQNIGLSTGTPSLDPNPAEDPEQTASDLVAHLANHPHDFAAREQLAAFYADFYQRMDLAADQLEQLLATPGQPEKQQVRWLNMLCDFHIRVDGDTGKAREALLRVGELFPGGAAEATALKRMPFLERDAANAKTSRPEVRLGDYEQDIGIKSGKPKPPDQWGTPPP